MRVCHRELRRGLLERRVFQLWDAGEEACVRVKARVEEEARGNGTCGRGGPWARCGRGCSTGECETPETRTAGHACGATKTRA